MVGASLVICSRRTCSDVITNPQKEIIPLQAKVKHVKQTTKLFIIHHNFKEDMAIFYEL